MGTVDIPIRWDLVWLKMYLMNEFSYLGGCGDGERGKNYW